MSRGWSRGLRRRRRSKEGRGVRREEEEEEEEGDVEEDVWRLYAVEAGGVEGVK